MKLFEIAEEYQQVLDNICDPETGEINEKSIAKLDDVGKEFDKKCIAVASYIKNLEAERQAIEDAKIAMAAREASFKKIVNNMSSYLQSNMERTQKNEINCPYFSIKLKKCPVSVNIENEDAIPVIYKKTKEVVSVDKMKIKEEILNGAFIEGASLQQNMRLEIR